MSIVPKHTPLTTDEQGLSFFIQRAGDSLPVNQALRELPLNGFEAEATCVFFDPKVEETTGRLLLRVTDNGHGMSAESLREHIKSLFRSSKALGDNHGLGARVATLARNPSGVTWASRHEGKENMVKVIKRNEVFGLERWAFDQPIEDGTFYDDVVAPEDDMLVESLLPAGSSGTAVILEGNGREDTWTSTSEIVGYLVKRWWQMPGEIRVWNQAEKAGDGGWRRVQGMSEFAERNAAARGTIDTRVDDLANIKIHWFLLNEGVNSPWGIRHGQIGALLENELFRWNDTPYRMVQFGITSRAVQNRLVIVIELPEYKHNNVTGWRMTIGRDDIERAGGRNDIDWAKVGEAFVAQMPAAIEGLLVGEAATPSYEKLLRKRFSAEWHLMIADLPQGDEPQGSNGVKDRPGDDVLLPRKRQRNKPENHVTVVPPEETTEQKREAKDKPVQEALWTKQEKEKHHDFPTPKWVPAHDFPGKSGRAVCFVRAKNEILMVEDHYFVRQYISYSKKQYPNISSSIIETKVREEFAAEILAKVLHVNALRKDPNITREDIEGMQSDDALTTSIAGMQAITFRINKTLSLVGR